MKAEKALVIFLSITMFLLLTIIMFLLVLFNVISIDLVFMTPPRPKGRGFESLGLGC